MIFRDSVVAWKNLSSVYDTACLFLWHKPCTGMAIQVKRLTNTTDLLFEVKDTFHSSVDPPSLTRVMVEKKLIRKKEKKFLDISDSSTQSSFLFSKFFRSDQRFTLTSQEFIDLLKSTNNDKNIEFADHLQRLHDENEKQFLKTQTSLLCEELAEDGQTVLQDQDTESLLLIPPVQPLPRTDTLTKGPMYIHAHPTEPASAVFTCEGGILYSPYHGVTVSIPEGAIPDKLRVTVSFWLVTDENKRCQLLDHPDFPLTAILIGCLFEFTATIETKTGPAESLDAFERDVWLSIPVFAYPTSESKTSSFSVLVENNGRLEREQSAIFAYSYPYVNVSTCHFSKRVAVEETTSFSRYQQKQVNKKRNISAVDGMCSSLRNLSLKKKHANNQSDRIPSSPDLSEEVRHYATYHANSPRTKRALFVEAKKVSNEASTSQEKDQPNTNGMQETSELNGRHPSNSSPEVATPECFSEPESMDTSDHIGSEDPSPRSSRLVLWLMEPVDKHDKLERYADLCILPHLPQSFAEMPRLISKSKDRLTFQFLGFKLKSNQDIVHFSSVSNSSPGWDVQLSRHQILIDDITSSVILFSHRSLSLNNLPMVRATVKNNGAKGGLHHKITVEESQPEAFCIVQSQPKDSTDLGGPKPGHHPTDVSLNWDKDRYLLALLSVVIPPSQSELRRLVGSLGLDAIVVEQIENDHLENHVGEKIYSAFCRARTMSKLFGKDLTFGVLCTFLAPSEEEYSLSSDMYKLYLQLLRNYFAYKTLPSVQSLHGTDYCVDFVHWALKALYFVPPKADLDKPLSDAKRSELFRELALKITRVWKMFGRFFGMEDSEIDSIALQFRNDRPDEAPLQMLRCLAQQFPQVTLSHILSVLQVLALGTGSVGDALHFVSHSFITQQACTD